MKNNKILKTFPKFSFSELEKNNGNPTNRLYGLRFYKDQSQVEYLAEFLLVFSSAKNNNGDNEYSFDIIQDEKGKAYYFPEDKLPLKLFSFFLNSKLDSRHPVHLREYNNILDKLSDKISNDIDKEETIKLFQNLLSGFVGVSQGRTWTAHSFLPVAGNLLSREIMWNNTQANKKLKKTDTWDAAKYYMNFDKHSFMARGGEVLFLQISNLRRKYSFSRPASDLNQKYYSHLNSFEKKSFKKNSNPVLIFEEKLKLLLNESNANLNEVVDFIEENLADWSYSKKPKKSPLGFSPDRATAEASLFLFEAINIIEGNAGLLEKIELLQLLCCLHVLRSFCCQAVSLDQKEDVIDGFLGNYVWVPCAFDSRMRDDDSITAQRSFEKIQTILHRVLRHESLPIPINKKGEVSYVEAEKHSINLFRKLAKELKLVIPRTGKGERFALNQTLLRFFVATLISPGERIYLNTFYERLFSHYGIALSGEQLTTALQWLGDKNQEYYAEQSRTTWVEETLKQGGFLLELSDSVSMVTNPR